MNATFRTVSPWNEVQYENDLWEEGLKPENQISEEEWARQLKEWGFPDDYRDYNGLYLGDWKPLCDDGPPFSSIKTGAKPKWMRLLEMRPMRIVKI